MAWVVGVMEGQRGLKGGVGAGRQGGSWRDKPPSITWANRGGSSVGGWFVGISDGYAKKQPQEGREHSRILL
jgi:hypothetical protein